MRSANKEQQIRSQEDRIPELAKNAFQEAYKNAYESGHSIAIVRGTSVVEVSKHSSSRVVASIEPGKKVKIGRSGIRIR
jgi:hypothetical protein